jgi:hypothetical protein
VDKAKKYNNDNKDNIHDDDDDDEYVNPVASVAALNALVPHSKITPLIQSKSNLQGTLQVAFHFAMFALAAAVVVPSSSYLAVMLSPHQQHFLNVISILAMAFVLSFFLSWFA